jgi:RNA polymerase sigma factor (sigma-70 family)
MEKPKPKNLAVKIRAQTKKVKGKLRWYLVRSYRDDAGKPRTEWLVYLGAPPENFLKKYIARMNKRRAWERGFPFKGKLKRIKEVVIDERKYRRNQRIQRLKRRRDLYAAHKAGLPVRQRCPHPKNTKDKFTQLMRHTWQITQALERIQADPRYGPMETWKGDRRKLLQIISWTLKPFVGLRLKCLAELIKRDPLADEISEWRSEMLKSKQELGSEPTEEELEDNAAELEEVLQFLGPREAAIIRYRYGIGVEEGRKKTLAEIGGEFHITRERVRQIEKETLPKMQILSRQKPHDSRKWVRRGGRMS